MKEMECQSATLWNKMEMATNLPPFEIRWRWSKEGIGHHMIIRLLCVYMIRFIFYGYIMTWKRLLIYMVRFMFYFYVIIWKRWHVNLHPFKYDGDGDPLLCKVRKGLATTTLFDDSMILSLCSYVIIWSFIWRRRWHVNPPPCKVKWRWPPPPF